MIRDTVIEIEICLQYLNDLFAKSVAFAADKELRQLNALRRQVYYGAFNYVAIMEKLEDIQKKLATYA